MKKNGKAVARAIADESVPMTFVRVLGKSFFRTTALRCLASIFRNFFFLQWRSALFPWKIPVSRADHPLDESIPFFPHKINTYIDFVAFWIRTLSFLLRHYDQHVRVQVRDFLKTMGELYAYAAEVYSRHLSTTYRPFYLGRLKFISIHTLDPHLMCIPSLHVMVVIRTYTWFEKIIRSFNDDSRFASRIEELRRGAIDITEAVLYIKQHSVNCIPAAMYAMTRYNGELFPPEEAERFAQGLFTRGKNLSSAESKEIRDFIITLYKQFLFRGEEQGPGSDWKIPLLEFLKTLPVVK
ncbi:MAG: hypothetical protein FWG77_06470 [Treponema sp.]|nr:hypothetical protein [Treponema sp.]